MLAFAVLLRTDQTFFALGHVDVIDGKASVFGAFRALSVITYTFPNIFIAHYEILLKSLF